jgi:hypothetical protein
MARGGWPLLLLLAVLTACGQRPHRNPDPRAMPGTDPGTTLRQVLRVLSLDLPEGAAKIRFRTREAIGPSSLSVTFVLPCDRVPAFLTDNGLTESRDANLSVAVDGARQDYGLGPDGLAKLYAPGRVAGVDTMGATAFELGGGSCQVIGVAEKF